MQEILLMLNQPEVLLTLFAGSILLILIDYLFPVDWPAYVGYALFGIFVGATIPLSAGYSVFSMLAVFSLMLTLHQAVFSKSLTNAPKHERARLDREQAGDVSATSTPNGESHQERNGRVEHVLR